MKTHSIEKACCAHQPCGPRPGRVRQSPASRALSAPRCGYPPAMQPKECFTQSPCLQAVCGYMPRQQKQCFAGRDSAGP